MLAWACTAIQTASSEMEAEAGIILKGIITCIRHFGPRPLDTTLHYTMDYDLWLRMGQWCDPLVIEAGGWKSASRMYALSSRWLIVGMIIWPRLIKNSAMRFGGKCARFKPKPKLGGM